MAGPAAATRSSKGAASSDGLPPQAVARAPPNRMARRRCAVPRCAARASAATRGSEAARRTRCPTGPTAGGAALVVTGALQPLPPRAPCPPFGQRLCMYNLLCGLDARLDSPAESIYIRDIEQYIYIYIYIYIISFDVIHIITGLGRARAPTAARGFSCLLLSPSKPGLDSPPTPPPTPSPTPPSLNRTPPGSRAPHAAGKSEGAGGGQLDSEAGKNPRPTGPFSFRPRLSRGREPGAPGAPQLPPATSESGATAASGAAPAPFKVVALVGAAASAAAHPQPEAERRSGLRHLSEASVPPG